MTEVLRDIPLALFTTLAPIGAGAFVALAIAFLTRTFTEQQLKAIDRFTIIPLLVALAGLIASFFHLTAPLNALNVARTIGSTPMANEIMAFGVFMVVAALYWLVALAGKLTYTARKVFSGVVALLAIVFAVFVGAAYLLETIPTWNNPFTPISIVGFALFGGVVLGLLVLCLADAGGEAVRGKGENRLFAAFSLGFVLALVGVIGLFTIGATTVSTVVDVSANTGNLIPAFVVFIVLTLIGFALGFFSIKLIPSTAVVSIALVIIGIAVFSARLVFYGMQIGIGL